MLKTIISLLFAVATFIAMVPALAQNQTEQVSCTQDYQCGYGNICEYNQCQPAQCVMSSQCLPWEKCDEGRCARDPWANICQNDKDCIAGYYCWAGYCKHY